MGMGLEDPMPRRLKLTGLSVDVISDIVCEYAALYV